MKGKDKMNITYKTQKDLPCEQLYQLFLAVGWADSAVSKEILNNFNVGFLHSTFVFSAWDGERLVGCVRVLSDLKFRSVIYDLAVLPDYQGMGIGKSLVQKCIAACPDSGWLVHTEDKEEFYKKVGFTMMEETVLSKKGKWC